MRVELAFEHYRQELMAYLARRLRHVEDAEDFVQETCLRCLRAAHGARNPHAYLFRIALNVIDDRRSVRRDIVILDSALADEAGLSAADTTNLPAEQEEREQRLATALSTLPPLHVSILVHRYIAGRSIPEIAAALGISRHTVKKYLFCAFARMRADRSA